MPIPNLSRRDFLTQSGVCLAALSGLGLSKSFGADTPTLMPEPIITGDGLYKTPPLPYPYEALEPAIDRQTMRLHHDLHFESYTKGLNEALTQLKQARLKNDFQVISHWENQLAFHGSGYMLHNLFFDSMIEPGKVNPSNNLQNMIAVHFESFEGFKQQMSAAALQVQGSGWAIMGYHPIGSRCMILQAEKHHDKTIWGIIPLLAIDVWEHAYYLKYQNKRADYINAWWSVIDWVKLEARLSGLKTALSA